MDKKIQELIIDCLVSYKTNELKSVDVEELELVSNAIDLVQSVNTREYFMDLQRSAEVNELLTPDDRQEIFISALTGSSDLTKELFEEVCHNYGTSLASVIGKSIIKNTEKEAAKNA